MKRFEAYWYEYTNEQEAIIKGTFNSKEFSTEQAMINFYVKHKRDPYMHHWFLSKRNADWEIIKDYNLKTIEVSL